MKAESLLNKLSEVTEAKKKESSMNDMGEMPKGVAGIIEKLGKNEFYKDNDSQKDMVSEMKKLAEMDCPFANKFMKGVDEACTKMYENIHLQMANKKNKK